MRPSAGWSRLPLGQACSKSTSERTLSSKPLGQAFLELEPRGKGQGPKAIGAADFMQAAGRLLPENQQIADKCLPLVIRVLAEKPVHRNKRE